ncbi:hypothetical protein, partial [Erwinia sp. JH02]|uniref:hypothetical protein n=1 Tax=Erwinia sp. JH02 TaxID=2733394 RepID=UPI00197DB882
PLTAVLAVRPGSLCFLSAAECRLNVKIQVKTHTQTRQKPKILIQINRRDRQVVGFLKPTASTVFAGMGPD